MWCMFSFGFMEFKKIWSIMNLSLFVIDFLYLSFYGSFHSYTTKIVLARVELQSLYCIIFMSNEIHMNIFYLFLSLR